jgi:hypothetical protein
VRTCLLQNSQAEKLNKKMSMQTLPTGSTLGGESLSSAIFKDSEINPKRIKQTFLICTTKNGMGTNMPVDEMERVYKAKVEAVLYHHEPLELLLDPMVIAALTLWHPPMKSFTPQHKSNIYLKYVVPINILTTSELVKYFGLLPGMATVSFNGVMLNRKSKERRLLTTSSSYDFVHDVSLSYL